MTIRHYCDRCDLEQDSYSLKEVTVSEIRSREFNLCDRCIKALARFLKVEASGWDI